MATAPQTLLIAIAAGQSLSAPIAIPGVILGFSFPANWTDAFASFQNSINNGPFLEVIRDGNNYLIDPQIPSYNAENKNLWGGVVNLVVRSGTVDNPVNQVNTVLITVVYEPFS